MGPLRKESRIGYLHSCALGEPGNEEFSVLEERNSILVSGVSYPSGDSRSSVACPKALEIAAESFLGRPSSSEEAMETIAGFINDGIYEMQEKDKHFLCNLAVVFVFKGKTRVYTAGDAVVMFFEDGELNNVWHGDGIPVGLSVKPGLSYSDEFELDGDARFIIAAGCDRGSMEAIEAFHRESNGKEPEDTEGFAKEKHCSYVNLYLPKRERRGFLR